MTRFRLYVTQGLAAETGIVLDKNQSHYLVNVMRAQTGESLALFNGRDGEWIGVLDKAAKTAAEVRIVRRRRPQAPQPDLLLLAAPIKKDRMDMVVEKAAELGASAFQPVFTRRTNAGRVNEERIAANLIEASEQCERLTIPTLIPAADLEKALARWEPDRPLLFLDESGAGAPILQALGDIAPGKLAVLVGPEGGFDDYERALLAKAPFAVPVSLGPRILRAETAAIAALSVVQAVLGDWNRAPRAS